jgi:transposase
MRIVIGIDVSKKKLDLSVYDGKKHKLSCVNNHHRGISAMLKKFGDSSTDYIFVMEATGVYHLKLATMLYDNGFKVGVINPLIIKRYYQMRMIRAKTDIVDAKLIAEYGFEQSVRLFSPPSKERQIIVKLLKAIDKLIVTKESYYNRLEALFQDPLQVGILNKNFKQLIHNIDSLIDKFEKELIEIVKQNYSETYERLLSIKGIGNKTAIVIIGFFGKFENFESSKQVASFIGVNPSPKQSGSSVRGRGRISKKGNSYLRKQLFMTSLSAMRYNKSCRELYQRLSLKGKEHKVCRIAVVNKLIKQVFAIIKYERFYDESYQRKTLPI